jgi:urease accessory protein
VLLEVKETYLRLSPDPVLRSMLEQMGAETTEDVLPFEPEAGAYSHGTHNHSESGHAHSHTRSSHVHD